MLRWIEGLRFLWASCALAAALGAAEHASTVEPVLVPDGELLKKLASLGDNGSCVLEGTKVIEDLGDFAKSWHDMKRTGPTGRDYSIKMAWMPDRKRAFYCGANHGSPHRFNDAWEFDLPSNTWVLLYTPDYNDAGKITDYDRQTLVLQDGWLRTKKGGPAHPAHTWWGLTYDPRAHAAIWFCAWPPYRLQEKLTAIGAKKEDLYAGPPLWAFHPFEKKWEPLPSQKPWPAGFKDAYGGSLEYVPGWNGSLWQYRSGTWLFDAGARTWKEITGGKEALPIETVVCHDPGRKLLIAFRGPVSETQTTSRTWHMALKEDATAGWEKALEAPDLPNGHDARTTMYFDPVGKVALLYEGKTKSIWAYAPDRKEWTKMAPQGPAPPFENERTIAYLDLERNVYVVIGYGRVWCYRFKRAA